MAEGVNIESRVRVGGRGAPADSGERSYGVPYTSLYLFPFVLRVLSMVSAVICTMLVVVCGCARARTREWLVFR